MFTDYLILNIFVWFAIATVSFFILLITKLLAGLFLYFIRGKPAYLQTNKRLKAKKKDVRGQLDTYHLFVSIEKRHDRKNYGQHPTLYVDIYKALWSKLRTIMLSDIELAQDYVDVMKMSVKKYENECDIELSEEEAFQRDKEEEVFAIRSWNGDVYEEDVVILDKHSNDVIDEKQNVEGGR